VTSSWFFRILYTDRLTGNVLARDCVQIVCKNVKYIYKGADKSLARTVS